MRVNPKEPFDLVFSLNKHINLGYVIELHAVQLMKNGKHSLLSQKLHSSAADGFMVPEDDLKLLKLLDETEPEVLIKKFYVSKKTIRQSDFFEKHYTEELHKKIRPYIENRLLKVIENLGPRKLYLAKDKNVVHQLVKFDAEKASILFHFRRNEEGTNYFATVKLNDKKINFSENGSELIIHEPAWLLTNNQLLTFKKNTDGNKISPFLNKRFISIAPRNEELYFEKFVKNLVEQYDVYAEGFEIITEQYRAFPVLKLTSFGEQAVCASLYFNYGPYQFPYHSVKMVSVSVEKKNNDFTFHRVRRSRQWEDIKKQILEKIGLSIYEGSLFISKEGSLKLLDIIGNNQTILKEQGFVIDQSLLKQTYFIGKSSVTFDIKKQGDWFDIHAIVQFGEFEVPFIKLKNNIVKGIREFLLPNGEIAIIPEEWFTRYSSLFDFVVVDKNKLKLKKHHIGLLDGLLENGEHAIGNDVNFDETVSYPIPKNLKATLRPYQVTGYNWLRYMSDKGYGVCLADDMGLGKTLQILAFLQYKNEARLPNTESNDKPSQVSEQPQFGLFESVENEPVSENEKTSVLPATAQQIIIQAPNTSLVVVPTSLIYNWQNEALKFTNLKVYVHIGIGRRKNLKDIIAHYDIIITSYGTLRNDINLFSSINFSNIVLDESQVIKNPGSLTAQCVMKLFSKQRFVITGTPVENSITDLWSQINFLNPGLLGNYNFFSKKYVVSIEKDKDENTTKILRNIVNPFILRRTKKQVATDLPLKTEQIRLCDMTEEQSERYESVKSLFRNELMASISNVGMNNSKLMILQGLTKLRQIANHPILAQEDYLDGSGKFNEVIEMVQKAIENKHKI
ncbi:MAG: SNF2-related protein, partial [bacterium]|nr:SNF2-related protein [bacterium]